MQGGAVLIPAPFPVCDGGLFCFPCFCPVSRAQRVPAPFPVCDGGLFCFRVSVSFPACSGFRPRFPFCPVSRVRWGPVLFPVFLSRFPHAAGSCPVSRSVPFPVCDGGLFCFRVSVSFPACSGFLPCSPVCNTGFLPVPGVAGRFPDACPIKYAAFLWLLSFH